jgi:hypothetical protein
MNLKVITIINQIVDLNRNINEIFITICNNYILSEEQYLKEISFSKK